MPLSNLWDDAKVGSLTPEERLIYRSNLLGSDPQITNTGGGNTSAKLPETDPLTGDPVEVLWVKGSGGDLKTSKLANFASLYQSKLLALQSLYAAKPAKGPKSEAEDAMVDCFPHCAFNLNPRAASIDTPLHSFVPFKHVDHMHPNAVIAIAASRRSQELTREVYGDQVGWTPWLRPGFELGLELQRRCQGEPGLQGIVLGQHGLINWANDDRDCYHLTLRLIDQAAAFIETRDKGDKTFGGQKHSPLAEADRHEILFELLPWLRTRVASGKRCIATVDTSAAVQRFINSHDAHRLAELGTSCPDHFLRTKIKPLYVAWEPATRDLQSLQTLLQASLEQYRRDYAAYYERCRHPDSPPMRDPNPTVILIPGIGMLAWGRNQFESQVTAEFYNCAIEVMRGAEAIDQYVALPEQEAFDIEYWRLEEAKLQRMPPENELSRSVVLLSGLSGALAKALAERLAGEGAHVALDTGPMQTTLTYGGLDYTVASGDGKILVTEVSVRSNTLRVTPRASIDSQMEAIRFLLSDRSSGIRNQVITVEHSG